MVVTDLEYLMPVMFGILVPGKVSKRNPEPGMVTKRKSGKVKGWATSPTGQTHVKIDPDDRATPYYVKLEDVI